VFTTFPIKARSRREDSSLAAARRVVATPRRRAGATKAAQPRARTGAWERLLLACSLLVLPALPTSAQLNPPPATYTRTYLNDVPNQPLVTITVTGAVNVTNFTIEETLPATATAMSVSGDGVYLPALNVIRWGPYFNTVATNVSYRLTGLPANYPVNGGAWMDGQWFFSPGITLVSVLPPAGSGGGVAPSPPPQVAAPVFTPPGGASVPVSVTITDATPGAVIYYTLDGSLPTQSSTLYTGPAPLASASVLRAAAFTNGWTPSVAVAAFYGQPAVAVNAQVTRNVSGNSTTAPMVTFNVTPGISANCVAVTESLAPGIGAINISSGGNYIASNNVVLWGPFLGTNVQTLSYQAVGMPGVYPVRVSWSVDGVSGTETTGTNLVIAASGVNGTIPTPPPQVAPPVFTPPSGAGVPVSVTIADATPAAAIFYTLDGSLPTPSSTLYTGPVPLASVSVLRAAAFTNGWTPSVAVAAYYGQPPIAANAQVARNVSGNSTAAPVVTFSVTPGAGAQCMAVTETLPAGIGATSISSGGNYIASNNVVLWGPFLGTNMQTLSYQAVGLPGVYPVRASWSVDGVSGTETTGTNLVIAAGGINGTLPFPPSQVATPVLLPAMASNLPVSVTITDATPAAMIYYTLDGSLPTPGSTLYTGPVPLASASVLRAAAFTNGWTPSVATVGVYIPPATTNTVSETHSVFGNGTFMPVVNLTAAPQGPVNCYAVVETIPPGLTPSGVSGDGIWEPSSGAIRWGPYFDNQPRGFSYSVSGLSGTYPLSGLVSFDGYSLSTGTTIVQINNSVTSLPIVTLLISNIVRNTDGSVTLNFAGPPNTTNRVWANTNLALPAGWQPIFTNTTTSPDGTWQFIDTNTAGYPIRFYRFSTP
jgi:Chitobiase/beta-hexosaminidase C-terminal domain